MKRFKYGLNSQVSQSANFYTLSCIGLIGVVPGDTISGKTTARIISESTTKPVQNRVYNDVYAFYVPYRLLWDDWPSWIAGDDSVTPPTLTASSGGLYQQCLMQASDEVIGKPAFGRRAYNLIWNKFFRDVSEPERDIDAVGAPATPLRKTQFTRRMLQEINLADQVIQVTDGEFTTGDVRQAFSQDRFNKTRAYYGDKYVDYLAALGVEATWSILDEPELIGASNKNLPYHSVDSTSGDASDDPSPQLQPLAAMAGRWQGSNTMTIRRTFCPEHGLIMMLQTTRMDLPPNNTVAPAELFKTTRDQYYSPEFETERKQAWTSFFAGTTDTMYTSKFEDYRVAQNHQRRVEDQSGQNPTQVNGPTIADPVTENALNYFGGSLIDGVLNDQFGPMVQLNLMADHRIARLSPVRPAQSVHGVS